MNIVFLSLGVLYGLVLVGVARLSSARLSLFYRHVPRPLIAALSLGVYCTAWTYFGAVGAAARQGLEFLPIFLGPIIPYTCGYLLLIRAVRLTQQFKITSVAEFIALRYGKSEVLAALVALIGTFATVPYIALQLKAMTLVLGVMVAFDGQSGHTPADLFDTARIHLIQPWILAILALALALFAIVMGARRIRTGAQREGMIAALALEAVFKLAVFAALGLFVMFVLYKDPGLLLAAAHHATLTQAILSAKINLPEFVSSILVVALAVPLLPRLFHVAFVENTKAQDFKVAAIVFPLYLLALAVFVMPMALAGLLILPKTVPLDLTTLALPLFGQEPLGGAAFSAPILSAPLLMMCVAIAGLSAGATMVVMACVALSVSLCNDVFMPLILRSPYVSRPETILDGSTLVLTLRRLGVILIFVLSCLYLGFASDRPFAQMGLVSMSGIAQIAPAALFGLIWRRATKLGALSGLVAGTFIWAVMAVWPLFAPSEGLFFDAPFFNNAATHVEDFGPLGLGVYWLVRGAYGVIAAFGLTNAPFAQMSMLSLGTNVICLVGLSLVTKQSAREAEMRDVFVPKRQSVAIPAYGARKGQSGSAHAASNMAHTGDPQSSVLSVTTQALGLAAQALMRPVPSLVSQNWRSGARVGELEMTVARYLGQERTREAFANFLAERGLSHDANFEADVHLIRFADQLLASVVGAASARLILSLLLGQRAMSRENALRLLDEASSAIQYNRDLLQHALDHARQGVTVFDRNLQLLCWNREFCNLFDLPGERLRLGTKLEEILRYNAERGMYGPGSSHLLVAARIQSLQNDLEPFRLRLYPSGTVVEIRSAHLPDGGLVTTYADVTETVEAEEALAATNELLEQRVSERTLQLVRLNAELAQAKNKADEANLSKTRFLAAASHDILQPLHAARLYASALVEKVAQASGIETLPEETRLARNIDASLEAVEEILTALLDISRLDAGAMKPELSTFYLNEILQQLALEFTPLAHEKGLRLTFVETHVAVRSDRRLLRRLLQNFISNAIKYTPKGRVLVGVRMMGEIVRVEVWDTGIGIAPEQQDVIFREFQRLDQGARTARGLGLGLSIVERLSRVLEHKITVRSRPNRGSVFAVNLPRVTRATMPASVGVRREPDAPPLLEEPLRGLVVLVLDNEPRIREGMRDLLSRWGCEVFCGASAEDLIGQCQSQDQRGVLQASGIQTSAAQSSVSRKKIIDPDVILADYHLDEGDGVSAVLSLRDQFGEGLMAALVTADRGLDVRQLAESHAIMLLHKPLRPAALRAVLTQLRAKRMALLRVAG